MVLGLPGPITAGVAATVSIQGLERVATQHPSMTMTSVPVRQRKLGEEIIHICIFFKFLSGDAQMVTAQVAQVEQ